MESDIIESLASLDLIDDDEIHSRPIHQFVSVPKAHSNTGNNIPGTTSVHELLECPVCTNSMYPPIHQVRPFLQFPQLVSFFLLIFVLPVLFFEDFEFLWDLILRGVCVSGFWLVGLLDSII